MRKILIPFDGSEASKRAVKEVIRFNADYAPLDIHLLNVQHTPRVYGNYVSTHMLEQFQEAGLHAGEQVLESATALLDEAGLSFQSHTALGFVADEVVRTVEEQGIQLVVMGTRGLTGLAHVLLGSTATKVIHEVSVPVLLVK